MGAYGYYTGNKNITEDKIAEFTERVIKILYYGGMMRFEEVNLFERKILLLKPIRLEGKESVKKDKEQRTTAANSALQEVEAWSLRLPARVIVYLTAELTGNEFWACWNDLKHEVYHDEVMRQYESDEIKKTRMELRQMPITSVRTA